MALFFRKTQIGQPLPLFSDFSRYGKELANLITPGLKAQAKLDEHVRFLANSPDGNGVIVVHNDRTVIYYDKNLKKGDTWEFTGLDLPMDNCMYPASSTVITANGTQSLMITHNRELSRLFLFDDTKTCIFKDYPLPTLSHSIRHTVEITNDQKNSFNFVNTGINFYGSIDASINVWWYDGTSFTYNAAVGPGALTVTQYILFHVRDNYLYGLRMPPPQYNQETVIYSFEVDQASYHSAPPQIEAFIPVTSQSTITVPLYVVPEYFYENDTYFAVIFFTAPDTPEFISREALCAVFSRSSGKTISVTYFTDFNESTRPYFAFGTDRVYIAREDTLFAVEVLP